MNYIGKRKINKVVYPLFKSYILDYLDIGYQIKDIKADKQVFYDYESFDKYIKSVSKVNKFCITFQKNRNKIILRNEWFVKKKWFEEHLIENEYDIYQEDMKKISVKRSGNYTQLFKFGIFDNRAGSKPLSLIWIMPLCSLLLFIPTFNPYIILILIVLLFFLDKLYVYLKPAMKI